MVGIAGAGMSGIAEILLQEGFLVSGSDLHDSPTIHHLKTLGANIGIGHEAANIGDAQVVVKSTAISDSNPEILEAMRRNIPVIPRAEMLAELMRMRSGIAVAGTHGKTTTTSLVASIFDGAGLDPTVVIGGRLNIYGANAHLGTGEYFVAEADESDGSFLLLLPIVNIVTNIDDDHLDHYGDSENLDAAFVRFMNNVPFHGLNIVCGDNQRLKALLPKVKRPVLTYGLGGDNELRAVINDTGSVSDYQVLRHGKVLGNVRLPQPGRHNVLNSLAAIGAALAANIPFAKCATGLENFKGVGRRFEHKGEKNGVAVIDDYGHHPTEIASTLAAARDVFPGRRLVAAFQPHRFSRTQALFEKFCSIFNGVDQLLLTEIYAASEKPIPGVSGRILADGIRNHGGVPVRYYETLETMIGDLDHVLRPGDVFLTLGAGSITSVGPAWLENANA